MTVALDQTRIEPTLEEVAIERVTDVERLGVATVEPLHALGQILPRRFHEEVVVVRQEAISMTEPTATVSQLVQERQKAKMVVEVEEDRLPAVATSGDVEDPAGDFQTKRTRHVTSVGAGAPVRSGFHRLDPWAAAFPDTSGSDPWLELGEPLEPDEAPVGGSLRCRRAAAAPELPQRERGMARAQARDLLELGRQVVEPAVLLETPDGP